MRGAYIVTVPYVTLKVKDTNGVFVLRGFYAGAEIQADDVEAESLRHHVDGGMMAKADSAEAAADGVPAGSPKEHEPPNVLVAGETQDVKPVESAAKAKAAK